LKTNISSPFHFYFLIEELSTPFVHLKELYKDNTKLNDAFGAVFGVLFLLARIGFGSYLYIAAVVNTMDPRLIK
jgi:hypothetical protein